jgi:demethylmenaquinone methyltransferase / 2-methoxy-6-polyprenyl-1,4-benzoquinol methylase
MLDWRDVFASNRRALQDSKFVRETFQSIAPRYDIANHVLSGGVDYWWRWRAARIVASWRPGRILDLATGSGDLALTLQRHCPGAQVTGADFCEPMLAKARRKGLSNVVLADAMNLPFAGETFDALTVAFGLRNMESWPGALREMVRVLSPGGHVLVLDFSLPQNPLLRPLYRLYLHSVLPLAAGLLTGRRGAYEYLGQSIEKFPCGTEMTALMEENGFRDARCIPLTGGIVSLYAAAKK